MYLDGLDQGEILIPRQYIPPDTRPGDWLEVFIYFDSDDRIIATTLKPRAEVGEFAFLKVVSVNTTGAFLDWGLAKDLLVPFREQKKDMVEGRSYLVYVYLDTASNRIVASAKIEKYFSTEFPEYETGEAVTLLIYQKSDIGFKALVNQKHLGIVHNSDVFKPLHSGMELVGYIKQVKPDGKIDLLLQKPGYENIDSLASELLDIMKKNRGFLGLTDKSEAETIYEKLGWSKKTFKKAVGSLYKNRLIALETDGIRLINP